MKLTSLNTFTFLFVLSFLFANVSGNLVTNLAQGFKSLLFKSKIPSSLARIIPGKSNLDKALFVKDKVDKISDVNDYLEIRKINYVNGYLEKYGYLDPSTSNPNSIDESSLMEFQKFFNLTPTGQLDQNTYNILTKPRCGVADIVSETFSFKPWWTGTELTYGFHPQNKVTDNFKFLFQDAFNRWSKVTGLKFTETMTFSDSDIQIGFSPSGLKGGMVGGSFINKVNNVGIMIFDSNEQWVLSSKSVIKQGDVDLESFVMHQIGHLLGLEHSSVKEAIMYPIVLPEKKIALVNDDDLHKIQQIYGVNT